MSTIRDEFEALLPEPAAWTLGQELQQRETTCKAHMWFVNPKNSSWAPLYTAEQMREMFDAATERAAKLCEETEVVEVQGSNSYYCQLGDAAATRAACAAAIRAKGGEAK